MEVAVENNVHKFVRAIEASFVSGIFAEELRSDALSKLESNRFPTTQDEYWKYTRVNRISTKQFKIQQGEISNIDTFKIQGLNADVVVFVNGFFMPALSSISDENAQYLSIVSVSGNKVSNIENGVHIFDQINTAFATDGIELIVPKNVVLSRSIEVIHIQTGYELIANLHHQIRVERQAQANVVMSFHSRDAKHCFSNLRTCIQLEDGAHLNLTKIQTESNDNYHVATEDVDQELNSNFTINTITLGGELVRNNLNIRVNGQNCETNLYGAYILKDNQHVDNHTFIDHRVPNCLSNELYKGVVDDKATAVFNGKVFVRKNAQKINAYQSNGNVLLSDSASVNSKPELEIYADDVKCSHGSTIGQLDEKAVFYLRSRGLSDKQARELLVQAFVSDVLDKLSDEVRAFVDNILVKRFGWNLI
jgi:Fe-S cluster assembly protein SufD